MSGEGVGDYYFKVTGVIILTAKIYKSPTPPPTPPCPRPCPMPVRVFRMKITSWYLLESVQNRQMSLELLVKELVPLWKNGSATPPKEQVPFYSIWHLKLQTILTVTVFFSLCY